MDMNWLFVRMGRRFQRLDPGKVGYFAAEKAGCRIVLRDEVIRVSATFVELELLLDPTEFCRVHEKFIVSISCIEAFDLAWMKVCGEALPIGEGFINSFFRQVWVFPARKIACAHSAIPPAGDGAAIER
jgi:DNA-binding LytR/AlgR family response regulator